MWGGVKSRTPGNGVGVDDPAAPSGASTEPDETQSPGGFLPVQPERRRPESVLVRVVATAGVIGIATAVGAIMGVKDVATWIISLVVSALSVVLAAVLWRSRHL